MGERWPDYNAIMESEETDLKEKGLMAILFRYVNHKNGYASPSRALLKKLTKIKHDETLDKLLNSLIEKGFLIRYSGKGVRSKYFIKVPPKNEVPTKNGVPSESSGLLPPINEGGVPPKNGGQKENKRKLKENIYSAFDSYTENEDLKKALIDFAEMRKEIKKPLKTSRAITLLINKLDKLAEDDETKVKILEQSIFYNWQGIFLLKEQEQMAKKEAVATVMPIVNETDIDVV